MSETPAAKARDGVPEDYPGRVVDFPATMQRMVYALFGVQSDDEARTRTFATTCAALARGSDGAAQLERCAYVDSAGIACTIMMGYWTDEAAYQRWWNSTAVQSWWQQCCTEASGESGYWREILSPRVERFQYAAGTEDQAGSAAALALRPCATFGYWGAYRDRLPASSEDDFLSPLTSVPAPHSQQTRGRRLRVETPDNLCFIREGQGWGNCGAEELAIWKTEMEPVVGTWVEVLGRDPVATGCLSIRDCQELDVDDGAPNARRSQLAFLLSLGHIEHAARTEPAHLAVHASFIRMYTEPRFTPQMHVWVEVHILKRDELETDYVNCHPATGLLPFFEVEDIVAPN